MLNPTGKTKWPAWACPFVPVWMGDQWIVIFTDEAQAREGLAVMNDKPLPGQLALDLAPMPDGSSQWYVGVAD